MSFALGERAFQNYLADVGVKRLPQIIDYITSTEVRVDRSGARILNRDKRIS
jgi:hypothetical protein